MGKLLASLSAQITAPEVPVELPTGDFVRGFVAPWQVKTAFRFWTTADTSEARCDWKKVVSSGSFMYYNNPTIANEDAKAMGADYGARAVWIWSTPIASIINLETERKTKLITSFGDMMTMEVDVSTLRQKNAHQFQMLALPSAVQAFAIGDGSIASKIFDFSSLSDLKSEQITPEFQHTMIGNGKPDGSVLWNARTTLWKMLGEEDAATYTVRQGKMQDTTAPLLADYLRLLMYTPPTEIWAQLVNVLDPNAEAVRKKGGVVVVDDEGKAKHNYAFIVDGIFGNEAEAREALNLPSSTDGSLVPPPAAWRDDVNAWKGYVVEIKKQITAKIKSDKKVKPAIDKVLNNPIALKVYVDAMDQEFKDNYDVSAADVWAWWNEVD